MPEIGVEDGAAPECARVDASALGAQAVERRPVTDRPDQADSLWRPRARRAFRIDRPARVLIRWRNPCFLARWRLLGWKVRFTRTTPRGSGLQNLQLTIGTRSVARHHRIAGTTQFADAGTRRDAVRKPNHSARPATRLRPC